MTSTRRIYCFFLFIVLIGMATGVMAQNVDTHPMRGFMPNMDQLSSPADNIDVATGKLHLSIPLASLPRGKGGTGFDLNLEYDSNIYDLYPIKEYGCSYYGMGCVEDTLNYLIPSMYSGGWTGNGYNPGIEMEWKLLTPDVNCSNMPGWGVPTGYKYRVMLSDGSQHVLYLKGYEGLGGPDAFYEMTMDGSFNQCAASRGYRSSTSGILTYYTIDGSYLRYEVNTSNPATGTLYFRDGSHWVVPPPAGYGGMITQYDANGNYITQQNFFTNNGDVLYTQITDQNGKQIRVDYNIQSTDTWRRDQVKAPGPNGDVYYYIDSQNIRVGQNRQYITGFKQYPEPFRGWQYYSLDRYMRVIRYIHLPLPDQPNVPSNLGNAPTHPEFSYAFGYWDDSSLFADGTPNANSPGFGQLNYMRMPSGAVYKYTYQVCAEGDTACPRAEGIAKKMSVSSKTVISDSPQLQWTFENNSNQLLRTVHNPDGGQTVFTMDGFGHTALIQAYGNDGQNVRTETKRVWASYSPAYLGSSIGNFYTQKEIASTRNNSNPANDKSAITTFNYDYNGNVLAKTEYDWVSYGTETGSTIKRKTAYDYYLSTAGNTNLYWYIEGGPKRLNAVQRQTIFEGASTPKTAVEFVYDDAYTRGNVRFEMHWDSVKSPSLPALGSMSNWNAQVLERQYDAYGNLTDKYEPEVRTHITYDSTGSLVTQVDTAYQTPAQRSVGYNWNANGMVLLSKTDLNNNLTTYNTYDNVGRQLYSYMPGLLQTQTIYDDANRKVTVKSDLRTFGDGLLQSITHYDQLGRVKLAQKSDGAPLYSNTDGIKVGTNYIYPIPVNGIYPWSGRRVISSSPYRNFSDSTLEWTCTQYDVLNRVMAAAMFKGSTAPTNCNPSATSTGITYTAYDADDQGSTVTVTDPAGKARRQSSDVLGRLVRVVEDPTGLNYTTTYNYDILGNLTQVNQGSQTRTFSYSSLGRLMNANNPESGAISYSYLDSGDLYQKTDARGITATMTYDPLHRITFKDYSDATPDFTYEYYLAENSTTPNIGQLKKVSSSVGYTTYVYNQLGKVASSSQIISGFSGSPAFSYLYYLNGALKSELYPSGRLINYDVDDAGRTNKVYTAAKTYGNATGAPADMFTADGRLKQMLLGNTLWETHDYQTPGTATPTSYKLGTTQGNWNVAKFDYYFNASQNNGNVISQTIMRNGSSTWTQTYNYDGVNRLLGVSESPGTPWSQSYGYDQYGNRYIATSGLPLESHEPNSPSNFNASNNRLTMTGITYDAAGNQTAYAPYTLTYDAENRNTFVNSSGTPYVTFAYDGDGHRVMKQANGINTYYVYDALGQMAAEYSNQAPTTGTSYMFTDMLGSVRTITNQAGTVVENYDYLPFGRMLNSSTNGRANLNFPNYPDVPNALNSVTPQKFTGKERDAETGLDYFGARYYSAALGRFASADPSPMGISLLDPQSWNRYSYVQNRALSFVDGNGKWATPRHGDITVIALQGYVSPAVLSTIVNSNKGVDKDQSTAGAFKHAMHATDQSPEAALSQMFDYVDDRLTFSTTARLGEALHSLQDWVAPGHTDGNFMPLVWKGKSHAIVHLLGSTLRHYSGEDSSSDDWYRFGLAVRITMAAFMDSWAEEAKSAGLTPETFESQYQVRITRYIGDYFSAIASMRAAKNSSQYFAEKNQIDRESEVARLCALGAPAACSQ